MLPTWLANNPDSIMTGSLIVDQLLQVMLGTSMFVGGFFGFLLDNTIPGARVKIAHVKLNHALEEIS